MQYLTIQKKQTRMNGRPKVAMPPAVIATPTPEEWLHRPLVLRAKRGPVLQTCPKFEHEFVVSLEKNK